MISRRDTIFKTPFYLDMQETIDTSPVSRSAELTIFDEVLLFYRSDRSFLHGPVIRRGQMEYLHHTGLSARSIPGVSSNDVSE